MLLRLLAFTVLNVAVCLTGVRGARAADEAKVEIPPIAITRATGAVEVDGDLSDPGWQGAVRIDGDAELPRHRVRYTLQVSPGRLISRLSVEGFVGEEIDFANNRVGTGADVIMGGTIRPTDHLELRLNASRRWLNVDPGTVPQGRLFTAQVERLRATYTFTPRLFVRAIGQYVETRREPSRYDFAVAPRSASFGGSALFAYKLNW